MSIARRVISASPSLSINTAKGPPDIATRIGRSVTRLMSMNKSHFRLSFPAWPRKSTWSQNTLEKCRTSLFSVPIPMLRMAASLELDRVGVKLTCRQTEHICMRKYRMGSSVFSSVNDTVRKHRLRDLHSERALIESTRQDQSMGNHLHQVAPQSAFSVLFSPLRMLSKHVFEGS